MRRDRGLERYDPRTLPVCERLVERGRHGQKTQAGYHDYGTPDRAARRSPEVEALIRDVARELGMAQREVTDEEIVERCILALFNTGCEVLGEGMAYRAGDIDTVYLRGYAFPAHRGGPMFWGEHTLGLDVALDRIERLSEHTGARWLAPSAHLRRWVAAGASLHRPPAPASAVH
jgi:3-hydroxyacyl-CoA dehydrogenase